MSYGCRKTSITIILYSFLQTDGKGNSVQRNNACVSDHSVQQNNAALSDLEHGDAVQVRILLDCFACDMVTVPILYNFVLMRCEQILSFTDAFILLGLQHIKNKFNRSRKNYITKETYLCSPRSKTGVKTQLT